MQYYEVWNCEGGVLLKSKNVVSNAPYFGPVKFPNDNIRYVQHVWYYTVFRLQLWGGVYHL